MRRLRRRLGGSSTNSQATAAAAARFLRPLPMDRGPSCGMLGLTLAITTTRQYISLCTLSMLIQRLCSIITHQRSSGSHEFEFASNNFGASSIWDDERGVGTLRKNCALRDEVQTTVSENRRAWFDTPSSLFAIQCGCLFSSFFASFRSI
jgi:hypothetical protein